jgi:hypothetical protein
MTIHLEWHPHAFIKDNKVINIAVFDESAHDSQLLNNVKTSMGADAVVCCCTFGTAGIGYEWNGTYFKPPMPVVEGVTFIWNEDSLTWVEQTQP